MTRQSNSRSNPRRATRGKFYWLIRVLVFGAISLSIALNVALWLQLKHEYREMKLVRLDPLGTNFATFPPDQLQAANAAAPRVLFFGDSRARAWRVPEGSRLRFSNRGIDGQTTEQAARRCDDTFKSLRPNVVVVECGVNDLTAIGILPEQRTAIVKHCEENLARIVDSARANGAVVVLCTIFPTGSVDLGRKPFWSGQISDAITEVNDRIRKMQQPDVLILDADKMLLSGQGIRRELYVDTLHLNANGYALLNESLRQLLPAPPIPLSARN